MLGPEEGPRCIHHSERVRGIGPVIWTGRLLEAEQLPEAGAFLTLCLVCLTFETGTGRF